MLNHPLDKEYFKEFGAPIMENAHSDHFTNINSTIAFFGPMMYFLIRALRCEKVLEIGTAQGYTALYMASAVRDNAVRFQYRNPMYYGIDIVAPRNEAIKATLDGMVVLSTWTSETGYILGIQHNNNLLSIYKHNSVLLKKAGNYVKAGEVIAIIGESGELTTGLHLHFELWHHGRPVNPQDYIIF